MAVTSVRRHNIMLNYFNVGDINHFILMGIKGKVDDDLLPE